MAEERVTVREVIRRRIFQEVAEFHAKEARGAIPWSCVRPTEVETALNGPRDPRHPRPRIDPEWQFEAAVKAFAGNGFRS